MPTGPSPFPARTAQAAIIIGFLLGTWMLTDGLHVAIVGTLVRWRGFPWGPAAPWGWVVAFGGLWMLIPNLLLFHNRRWAWAAMVALAVASAWYWGPASLALGLIVVLLLLPATRRGLSG